MACEAPSCRLAAGGRIDRERKLGFLFNGRRYEGHPGDTLASALIANGVSVVARSIKLHRPRGIVGHGVDEPNAVVQVGVGPRVNPCVKATEVELHDGLIATSANGWPSIDTDVFAGLSMFARLMPSGFYYKSLMPSLRLWHRLFEPAIRTVAGWAEAPHEPDGDRYDHRNVHCDVLVVGGGPAGLAAALAAGRSGARVVLADEQGEMGGSLLHLPRHIDQMAGADWVMETLAVLATMPDVTILPRTSVFGLYEGCYATALERCTDHLGPQIGSPLARQRLWHIRAGRVVLATGATERTVVFPGNDRPGVMLVGAVHAYLARWAVAAGRQAVVFTTNDSAYEAALALYDAGIGVAAIVDARPHGGGALAEQAKARGIVVHDGFVVVATSGRQRLSRVRIRPVSGEGRAFSIKCDLLAVSGGWNPNVQLWTQAQGGLVWDDDQACFRPATCPHPVTSAGAANGALTLAEALAEGLEAGGGEGEAPTVDEPSMLLPHALWQVEAGHAPTWGRRAGFVDLQNDTTEADILLAIREGFDSPDLLKRYTLTGFGTDQGRTSSVNAIGILAQALGRPMSDYAPTTMRPPVTPVPFGAMAGRAVGARAAPARLTPMHDWHEIAGATFMDVGPWRRPRCYRLPGETTHHAIEREVIGVRDRVGLYDASSLGKIEVQGPDAGLFLDRLYVGAGGAMGVGRVRYDMMLTDEGIILDDGTRARLADDHWLLTTTTGNAQTVLRHMELWQQTEWPDLRVFITDVSDQWATVTLTGPKARDVLARLAPDVYMGTKAFPFMSMQDAAVAGLPARVARISFTGELSFEISVSWALGLTLWQACLEAGASLGIVPFGVGSLEVMRAEKGFVLIGHETDGTTIPDDLGYGRLICQSKGDFIGKRSLLRPAFQGPGRRQLIGFLTEDPRVVLPEGAQLVTERGGEPPMTVVGHVTSSAYSPTMGRSIALAMVRDGRALIGRQLHAPLGDRWVTGDVVESVFFDKEGRRRDG